MSDLIELARSLRPYIEQAAQSLPDADGLKAKALYPRWEKLVQLGSVNADDTLSGLPSMSACNLLVTIGV